MMTKMPDTERRATLAARAQRLREEAVRLRTQLRDDGMIDLLRRLVLNPVEDVETFFLGEPLSRPSVSSYESSWLDHAEIVLHSAEEQLKRLSADIDRYGGPEHVRTVG